MATLVFQLRKPTVPRRLAQRLRTVADSEGVASSPAALATLADAADGGVRAAIGSLQFAVTASGDRKDAAKGHESHLAPRPSRPRRIGPPTSPSSLLAYLR